MPNTPSKIFIEQLTEGGIQTDMLTDLKNPPVKKEQNKPADPKSIVKTGHMEDKESVKRTPEDLAKEKKVTPHDPNLYRIMFFMKQFRIQDIVIKVVDRTLVIDAAHKEHVDEHGFVTRSVVRKQNLPDDVVREKLTSYFTANGVLVIQAPLIEG